MSLDGGPPVHRFAPEGPLDLPPGADSATLHLGDERPFSSLRRAVEHEAFVSLAARDLGVQTPRLRAVATVEPGAIALAYDSVDGRSLDRVPPEQLTDDVLAGVWAQMAVLRRHRIAHRDLRLANLFLGADGTGLLRDRRQVKIGRAHV